MTKQQGWIIIALLGMIGIELIMQTEPTYPKIATAIIFLGYVITGLLKSLDTRTH